MDFSQNYFQLFGLDEDFDIDLKKLARYYQELQKTLHPDRYASATERERRLSLQQAAQVNAAFQTLKDPLSRARYLLELRGVMNSEKTTIRDPEFLEQQMELREELSEIRYASDPLQRLSEFMSRLEKSINVCIDKLRQFFSQADALSLPQCQSAVHQLQFLYRLRQEAETLEETLL